MRAILVAGLLLCLLASAVRAEGEPLPILIERLRHIDSVPGVHQLGVQLQLLDSIASNGEESIPFLFEAIKLRHDSADNYDWALRDHLAKKCVQYPSAFSRIIEEDSDPLNRWYAIYAVRQSGEKRCFDAVRHVLNRNDAQDLRIQAMTAIGSLRVTPADVRTLAPGIVRLLRETPRDVDLERTIALAEYGQVREAVPALVPLLDNTNIYSSSKVDGEWVPDRIADKAHRALKAITGLDRHPLGMQVDPAVVSMLLCVESHPGSSFRPRWGG